MRGFIAKWFVMSIAVLATTYVVPGIVVADVGAAIIAALLLGLVNAFVRPVLVILTLPFTVLTLGLFLLVLNAFLLLLVAWLVDGLFVTGFWAALIGTIFISIIAGLLNALIRDRK